MKDSSVPDMYDKIEDESTVLGRLASKIPGFAGYMERSRRREADQILREAISSRLEASRLQLSNSIEELSRDIVKAIDYAESLGRADTKLMGLIGKIRDAPEGYAGFFDAVKIKEEDLAEIYAFDESILAYVDQVSLDVDAVEIAILEDGKIGGSIKNLDNTLREANSAFDTRRELLSGAL
jgi:Asp-tRNA(Asn)/Glu-tRNA(Gln) amidotransferase C subunit